MRGHMADKLGILLEGIGAATLLLNKAVEKQNAPESIGLQAGIIDSCLRVGLVLKAQLDSGTSDIDESLLNLSDDGSKIPETTIYQRCLDAKVIDQKLYTSLSQAYEKRSRQVAGKLLTDVDNNFATQIVFEQDDILISVRATIDHLEKQQLKRGVGMTKLGPAATKR